jgi:hypothetical protein
VLAIFFGEKLLPKAIDAKATKRLCTKLPHYRGIAGVDINKMKADGKAIGHWDVLQEIGDPNKAAHANGRF